MAMEGVFRFFTHAIASLSSLKFNFCSDAIYITPNFYVRLPPTSSSEIILVSTTASDLIWTRKISIDDLQALMDLLIACFDRPGRYSISIEDITCYIRNEKNLVRGHFFVPAGPLGGMNSDALLFSREQIESARKGISKIELEHG